MNDDFFPWPLNILISKFTAVVQPTEYGLPISIFLEPFLKRRGADVFQTLKIATERNFERSNVVDKCFPVHYHADIPNFPSSSSPMNSKILLFISELACDLRISNVMPSILELEQFHVLSNVYDFALCWGFRFGWQKSNTDSDMRQHASLLSIPTSYQYQELDGKAEWSRLNASQLPECDWLRQVFFVCVERVSN